MPSTASELDYVMHCNGTRRRNGQKALKKWRMKEIHAENILSVLGVIASFCWFLIFTAFLCVQDFELPTHLHIIKILPICINLFLPTDMMFRKKRTILHEKVIIGKSHLIPNVFISFDWFRKIQLNLFLKINLNIF